MTGEPEATGDALGERIAALQAAESGLSLLGAAILAVLDLSGNGNSRTLAKDFGVEHALVLREITALESGGRLVVERRDPRTMRSWIRLP